MKSKEFEDIIECQMEKCVDILIEKAKEYADHRDRLHNFKYAGSLQGISSVKALSGMMAKHTISVYDMCGSEALYPMALWEEKITDSINYLLLLKALLIDEGMVTHTEKGETTSACVVDEEVFNDEKLKKLYSEQLPKAEPYTIKGIEPTGDAYTCAADCSCCGIVECRVKREPKVGDERLKKLVESVKFGIINDEFTNKSINQVTRVDRSEKPDNNSDSIDALVYGAAVLEHRDKIIKNTKEPDNCDHNCIGCGSPADTCVHGSKETEGCVSDYKNVKEAEKVSNGKSKCSNNCAECAYRYDCTL